MEINYKKKKEFISILKINISNFLIYLETNVLNNKQHTLYLDKNVKLTVFATKD